MTSRDSQRRIVLYVAVLVAAALTAEGSEIRLRRQCLATASVVRLGDVAEFEDVSATEQQQLSSLALFPAPRVGLARRVTAQDIREIMSLYGIALPNVSVQGECRVEGAADPAISTAPSSSDAVASSPVVAATHTTAAAQTLSVPVVAAQLATPLTAYLVTKDRVPTQWRVAPLLTPDQAALIAAMETLQVTGGQSPWVGRQVFSVCDAENPTAKPITFKADIARIAHALVAGRNLNPGDTITANDVEIDEVNPLSLTATTVLAAENALGLEVKRPIAAGQLVNSLNLRKPLLVHRGEQITVYALAAGVQVKAQGKSLSEGAMGDVVVVQSAESSKQFQARVTAPQEVMVFVDSPVVPAEKSQSMQTRSAVAIQAK